MQVSHLHYGKEKSEVNVKIVIATSFSEDEFLGDREKIPAIYCLDRMDVGKTCSVDVDVVCENKEGLSTVYNRFLDDAVKDGECGDGNFVIFMHDDIWLNDVLVFEKLMSLSESLDVIGVAGGKTWNMKNTKVGRPIIWTVASANMGGSGFIVNAPPTKWNPKVHDMGFKGRTYYAANYGNSPSRTFTIDGCFMCFCRKAIEELRFDEQFKFHYYDMDVSFTAYSKKLRVGTAPIVLTHNSLGESVVNPSYLVMQRKFIKKWFVGK